jgi:hypothetical protein
VGAHRQVLQPDGSPPPHSCQARWPRHQTTHGHGLGELQPVSTRRVVGVLPPKKPQGGVRHRMGVRTTARQ